VDSVLSGRSKVSTRRHSFSDSLLVENVPLTSPLLPSTSDSATLTLPSVDVKQ
jgi:hypothetical protein